MLKKLSLILLILAFLVLSVYCQVSLFVSLVSNTQDQLHAAAFSVVLIYSQYMFVAQMAIKWRDRQVLLATVAAILAAIQITISTVVTAFYFESRYQSANHLATTTSNEHVIVKSLLTEKQRTVQQFKNLVTEELAKGNKWIAGQHMQKADRIEQELPALLTQLQNVKVTATGAAALGTAMGEFRWAAWFTLSVLADLIPATAIMLFVFSEQKQANSKTVTVSGQQKKETEQAQPEQQKGIPCWATFERVPTTSQPVECSDLLSLIGRLKRMPSWREANAAGLSYVKYKAQRDELQKQGKIKQTGQTFSLA